MFGQNIESVSNDDLDMLNMILFVKDRYNISGEAYHQLARICKDLPRHWKLKRRIKELNSLWNIYPTPNGTIGIQQKLEDRLSVRIRHLASHSQLKSNKVSIKLAGDGTNIGKHLHVINFTFTLIEEGSLAYGCEGNHSLAILKEPENYDSLSKGLEDLRKEVENLKSIEVDGRRYELEYYLGGDWKFLALVTGIDSAKSNFACIWCKCLKGDRADMEKEWSLLDSKLGARTIEENTELSRKSKKQFNVSRPPLFPTIPLKNVVIDNLHMFLRVSDVLFNLLIVKLKRQDAIEKLKTFSTFDRTRYRHLANYEELHD